MINITKILVIRSEILDPRNTRDPERPSRSQNYTLPRPLRRKQRRSARQTSVLAHTGPRRSSAPRRRTPLMQRRPIADRRQFRNARTRLRSVDHREYADNRRTPQPRRARTIRRIAIDEVTLIVEHLSPPAPNRSPAPPNRRIGGKGQSSQDRAGDRQTFMRDLHDPPFHPRGRSVNRRVRRTILAAPGRNCAPARTSMSPRTFPKSQPS